MDFKKLYKKPTTNVILQGEKLEAFPLKLKIRQRGPLVLLLFNIILVVLDNAVRRKEINAVETGKEENSEDASWIAEVKSTHLLPSRIPSILKDSKQLVKHDIRQAQGK